MCLVFGMCSSRRWHLMAPRLVVEWFCAPNDLGCDVLALRCSLPRRRLRSDVARDLFDAGQDKPSCPQAEEEAGNGAQDDIALSPADKLSSSVECHRKNEEEPEPPVQRTQALTQPGNNC